MNKNAAKRFHLNPRLMAIIVVFIFIAVAVYLKKASMEGACQIDDAYNLDDNVHRLLEHNYVIFWSKNNGEQTKLTEINGWLLLEAVIRKTLGVPTSPEFDAVVELFGPEYLVGWWPRDIHQNGKNYLLSGEEFSDYFDSDDTAWMHRYNNRFINDYVLKEFLSDSMLPQHFDGICAALNCNRSLIVRVWSNEDWHGRQDNANIVIIANFINMINISSDLSREVFENNKMLVNFIIENENIDDYFEYFDPEVTGYFLILFYDDHGNKFLTDNSRKILLKKLKESYNLLSNAPISGTNIEYWNKDCIIIYSNDKIPGLMLEYAKRWNI